MARQWLRLVRVTVSGSGGSAIFDGGQAPADGFKIDFTVSKGIGSKQNTATVTLWNLTKSNRSKLGEEFDQITLEVGYKDTGLSTIFKGQIRDVTHDKSSPDISSAIECGDGDEGVNKGAASKTFPAGTKPKEIVEHLRDQMPKVEKGEIVGLDDLPAYRRPVTVFGWSARELDQLGREHGFYWSIQNGKFNAVKNTKHLGGDIVVSRESGMIGIPQETDKGVKVKTLLNPRIEPGKTIEVKSDFLDEESGKDKRDSDAGGGKFRVQSVTHSGSSRGDEFYTEADANRVQGDEVTK